MPQRLRLRARRFRHLLPPLLHVVQLVRGLLDSSGFCSSGLPMLNFVAQRLDLGDQLFLDGRVGESLPLVHLAQLVQPRRHRPPSRPSAARRALAARARRLPAAHRWRRADRERPGRPRAAPDLRRGARCDALEQLLDALRLLTQRPFARGTLRFDARASPGPRPLRIWRRHRHRARRPGRSPCHSPATAFHAATSYSTGAPCRGQASPGASAASPSSARCRRRGRAGDAAMTCDQERRAVRDSSLKRR